MVKNNVFDHTGLERVNFGSAANVEWLIDLIPEDVALYCDNEAVVAHVVDANRECLNPAEFVE